jgi:CopG family transcriptional regulator/antitoxin EndoAI
MRTTETMTVSLPPAMVKQFETVRRAENRTRSELVREALRSYFESRYPAVLPTAAEMAAIRRGRAAFQRGDYSPLNEVLNELESARHRTRAKAIAKDSRKRPKAR